MSEVEVYQNGMDSEGGFNCPKCGKYINPDDYETGYEVLDIDGTCGAHELNSITIKCNCGQVVKICLN